jgi:uncharacterized membrane protein
VADVYTVRASGNLWPVEVLPAETPPLQPGEAAQVAVRVQIPAGPAGQADAVTIRAASSWDAAVFAEQQLVTTRLWGVYLPLIAK